MSRNTEPLGAYFSEIGDGPTIADLIAFADLVVEESTELRQAIPTLGYPQRRASRGEPPTFVRRLACGAVLRALSRDGLDDDKLADFAIKLRRMAEVIRERRQMIEAYDVIFGRFRDASLALVDLSQEEDMTGSHLGRSVDALVRPCLQHPICTTALIDHALEMMEDDARARVRIRTTIAIDLGLGTIKTVDGISGVECDAVTLRGILHFGENFREAALLLRGSIANEPD